MTVLNLRGIKWSGRANQILLVCMSAVIVGFLCLAVRYLFDAGSWTGLFGPAILCPPTFDGYRRLDGNIVRLPCLYRLRWDRHASRRRRNPKRKVVLARELICFFLGVFGGTEVYLGQRIWPV
jgi:hypothetical protein